MEKINMYKSCGNCEVEWVDEQCSTDWDRCDKCENFSEWKADACKLKYQPNDFVSPNTFDLERVLAENREWRRQEKEILLTKAIYY
jgi:hypothetical protein